MLLLALWSSIKISIIGAHNSCFCHQGFLQRLGNSKVSRVFESVDTGQINELVIKQKTAHLLSTFIIMANVS